MFWGLTPAIDFQEKYRHVQNSPKELNILIVGAADCRHVLKTIARKYRYEDVKINFYLMEACVENIARQLLFLMIALRPPKELGEIQRTRMFMELYGNTIVRPYVSKYLLYSSNELLKMITDYDYLRDILPNVEIDIKYKERDYLENLIKFWCSSDDFNICHSWDRKVRNMLGARYDAKSAAFDWDLHMRFHGVGGKSVCNQEYRSFRTNGIAFTWLESVASKPNRTYACVTIPNGEKFIHYGYLGDIQTGPFVAYGLECEDERFLQATNGQNKYRSTDVTERNLRQIFHEILFQTPYQYQEINDYQLGSATLAEEKLIVCTKADRLSNKKTFTKCIQLENINIKFISLSQLQRMNYQECFRNKFNIIYFNSAYLKYLKSDIIDHVASDNALLIVENQLFVLSHRDKQLEEFYSSLKAALEGLNITDLSFNPLKDTYAEFIIKN